MCASSVTAALICWMSCTLAPVVAVQELEALEHAVRPETVDHLEHLADEQPELRARPRALVPPPGALRRELDAHTDRRPHVVSLGVLDDQVELLEALDHGHDRSTELRRQDHGLDVARVLEPVADDQLVGAIAGEGHHREQLGLGPDLEPEAVVAPEQAQLLHDLVLLVDLDRVDRAVVAAVAVLLHRDAERLREAAQAVGEDVGEAQQHGRVDRPLLQSRHDVVEIGLAGARPRDDMALGVDREVPIAPRLDAVQLGRVGRRPGVGRRRLGLGQGVGLSGGAGRHGRNGTPPTGFG